jgi:hypothetical protein
MDPMHEQVHALPRDRDSGSALGSEVGSVRSFRRDREDHSPRPAASPGFQPLPRPTEPGPKRGDYVRESRESRDPPPTQFAATKRTLLVHVCGRLEGVGVTSASLGELSVAVEKNFDLRSPFHFSNKEGKQVVDDAEVLHAIETQEPMFVRMTEGAFHDFERRVDHYRHLQWGYLADELAVYRSQISVVQGEVKAAKLGLDQEAQNRQYGDSDLRRELEGLRVHVKQERTGREQGDNLVAEQVMEMKSQLLQEVLARELTIKDANTRMDELAGLVQDETRGRDQALLGQKREIDGLRELVHSEEVGREELEERVSRNISELRANMQANAIATTELVDALKLDYQNSRMAMEREFREKLDDVRDLRNRMKDLTMSQSRITSELKSADAELTQQLSVLVESLQEEQGIRNSEDKELEEAVRAVRLRMDDLAASNRDEQLKVDEAVEEISRRVEESTKAWQAEEARSANRQSESRKDLEGALGKLQAQVSKTQRALEEESQQRQVSFKELQVSLEQVEGSMVQEAKETVKNLDQLGDRVGSIRRALTDEQKERMAADAELQTRVRDAKQALEQEKQLRQADHSTAMLAVDDVIKNVKKDRVEETTKYDGFKKSLEVFQQGLAAARGESMGLHKELDAYRNETQSITGALREGIQLEQQGRIGVEQEIQLALRELRSAFEKQTRIREQNELKFAGSQKELSERTETDSKQLEIALSRLSHDISNTKQLVRDEQASRTEAEDKIREEVRSTSNLERNARTEADDILRHDVIEALSKETRTRQESDGKVVDDVAARLAEYRNAAEADFKARDEALEQLEEAVLELREGLEAHTHDLEVEGPPGGVQVRVQRVTLERQPVSDPLPLANSSRVEFRQPYHFFGGRLTSAPTRGLPLYL